jgi:pterin-4a-carbinolamine dehydratase
MEDKTVLSEEEILSGMPEGWKYDGKSLRREWNFEVFRDMPNFVLKTVQLMNEVNHHADISMDTKTKTVRISVTTHSIDHVTRADVDFAKKINELH